MLSEDSTEGVLHRIGPRPKPADSETNVRRSQRYQQYFIFSCNADQLLRDGQIFASMHF